jgi:TonB family protein
VTDSACGRCGAPRAPGSSAGGLCPACLLSVALADPALETMEGEDLAGIPEGTTFGPFLIRRPLGRGGMAVVYEALETRLERSVALKVLPAEFLHDSTFGRRFDTEARLAARLEHPNIVPIYATGIEAGIPWMSMRLLSGDNLSVLLRKRRLLPREAVQLLKQVAAALDYAHGFGVVHRDIKPANILLDRSGTASVADFGLAQLMESTSRLTRSGMLTGTPHYMAPEQALGQRVDHRCDIYALGIVAYEMLVGRTPFAGDSPVAVLMQQVHQPLPAPADHLSSAGWMDAISKATAKNPAERWPSAGAFVEALESSISAVPVAPEVAKSAPLGRAMHSPRAIWTGLAGVAALIAAAVLWVGKQPPDSVPPGPSSSPAIETDKGEQPTGPAASPPGNAGKPLPEPATPPARGTRARPAREETPRDAAPPPPQPSAGAAAANEPVTPAPPPSPSVGVDSLELGALPRLPVVVPSRPVAEVVTDAQLIHQVKPAYPSAAVTARVEGEVVLNGLVGVDGKVTDIKVERFDHKVLYQAAIDAFRDFRYTPARRNGIATPSRVSFTIRFNLDKD